MKGNDDNTPTERVRSRKLAAQNAQGSKLALRPAAESTRRSPAARALSRHGQDDTVRVVESPIRRAALPDQDDDDGNKSSRGRSREPSPAVGYGRPPHECQFKKGRSGNPTGRRKGSKNESTLLREVMQRSVGIRKADGRQRHIPLMQAILLKVAEDALKGNVKSASFLLNRYAALVSGELKHDDLSHDDQEVLAAFAARMRNTDGGNDA